MCLGLVLERLQSFLFRVFLFFFMLLSDTGDVAFPSLAPEGASTCIANEAGSVLQAAVRMADLIVHSISGPA